MYYFFVAVHRLVDCDLAFRGKPLNSFSGAIRVSNDQELSEVLKEFVLNSYKYDENLAIIFRIDNDSIAESTVLTVIEGNLSVYNNELGKKIHNMVMKSVQDILKEKLNKLKEVTN